MKTPRPLKEELQRLELQKEIKSSPSCKLRSLKEKPPCLSEKGSKKSSKKHGVTVTAIFLAAGATIGAVASTITNALKATGKAMGSGLKQVGSKLGSLLPGLIGQIVSLLFKTAGQAIGFLAEHTWLLILAAVVFIFQKYIKSGL